MDAERFWHVLEAVANGVLWGWGDDGGTFLVRLDTKTILELREAVEQRKAKA